MQVRIKSYKGPVSGWGSVKRCHGDLAARSHSYDVAVMRARELGWL